MISAPRILFWNKWRKETEGIQLTRIHLESMEVDRF